MVLGATGSFATLIQSTNNETDVHPKSPFDAVNADPDSVDPVRVVVVHG